jgi:hypothetical protein
MVNKNLLRKQFENVYKANKGKSTVDLIREVSGQNSLLEKVDVPSSSSNIKFEPEPVSSVRSSLFFYIFLLIFILVLLVLIWKHKDGIQEYVKKIYNDVTKNVNGADAKLKSIVQSEQEEAKKVDKPAQPPPPPSPHEPTIQTELDAAKKKEAEQKQGAVRKLDNKLKERANCIQPAENQVAAQNGYCYIGTDKGNRECTDIYASEICMSGQIFPTLAMCQLPGRFF